MQQITCSVNQPYFFPYFGYFLLLSKSDIFISLDDVNMQKKGFVHRNYILSQGKRSLFTVPIKKISQNKSINQTYLLDHKEFLGKFAKLLRVNYRNYKYYDQVEYILQKLSMCDVDTIADLSLSSVRIICDALQLGVDIKVSSGLQSNDLKGSDKILYLCKSVNASTYLNLPSGENLYDHAYFKKSGIDLMFLKYDTEKFSTMMPEDGLHLSILDTIAKFSFDELSQLFLDTKNKK